MRVTFSWLQCYVEIKESPQRIAERLTQAGLEVSACEHVCPSLEGVITGRVLTIQPHPHSDRLLVCRIDTGDGYCTVVCGAHNIREGDRVPLALPGARLPTAAPIKIADIHGVRSEGMLCSEYELGLSGDHTGIMILPEDVALGKGLVQALSLEDHVLEVEVTPNRPDCLSVIGIAREIAAFTKGSLRYPSIHLVEDEELASSVSTVQIMDPQLCHRYVARILKAVKIHQSPFWLRRTLLLVGIRPINIVVDITNFVMWEYGQPLHAFDLDLLAGRRIVVRRARAGERFVTLDGVERILTEDDLMICDASQSVALAGVMGGENSEIGDQTTSVLLESAFFAPMTIRRTSKRLGLSTEASYRFEREIDKEGTLRAADRAAQMMQTLACGCLLKGAIDVYPNRYEPSTIQLQVDKTNRLLGTTLSKDEAASLLKCLEMDVNSHKDRVLDVVPPPFRPDLKREVDLIEEVARLVDYDRIPQQMPNAPIAAPTMDPIRRAELHIRQVLLQTGFQETIHYSFLTLKDLLALYPENANHQHLPVKLLNPLSEEQAYLRTSLVPSLMETVAKNLRRMNRNLRLFELGKVFYPNDGEELPEERRMLAAAMTGRRYPDHWNLSGDAVDFFDIKGVLHVLLRTFGCDMYNFTHSEEICYLHPRCSGNILIGTTKIGWIGKVHPSVLEAFEIDQEVYLFELDFLALVAHGEQGKKYKPFSRYPTIERDIALMLDESVPFSEVLEKMKEFADSRVNKIDLFDVYRGKPIPEGKMSMAFRITYQDHSRTMTDEEVNRLQEKYIRTLLPVLNAQLR